MDATAVRGGPTRRGILGPDRSGSRRRRDDIPMPRRRPDVSADHGFYHVSAWPRSAQNHGPVWPEARAHGGADGGGKLTAAVDGAGAQVAAGLHAIAAAIENLAARLPLPDTQ